MYSLNSVVFCLDSGVHFKLLDHAGKISHAQALEKSGLEYEKYREEQKSLTRETSLQELEKDIKDVRKLASGKGEEK